LNALELERVGKIYRSGVTALHNVSLEVPTGEFFGLLGPNGAGKSTLIGIVSSLITKTSGRVRVAGHDLDSAPWEAKSRLGLVPQEFNFNTFETVQQVLLNQAGFYGVARADARRRMRMLLGELRLEDKQHSVSRALSGGMKRRLMVARALMHAPALLILDEPTAGVDIEVRRSMWEFLATINQRDGVTVILTTHYLEEAETLCRTIAIIDRGRIIEQSPTPELLRRLGSETFILDLAQPLEALPTLDGITCRLPAPQRLEVDIARGQTVSHVFAALQRQGIGVLSLKNRSNRLEELFLSLVGKQASPAARPVES
jgi:ABC-2 type transport system ATP-binding protein